MLKRLDIRNFMFVEQLSVDLAAGFSAITGETGAGKSIMLDALGLVLGDRASADSIRPGQDHADLSAEFHLQGASRARAWLEQRALDDPDSPENCLVRRHIGRDGRSRAFINGRPSTLQDVRALADLLVNIHAQHAHQALLQQDRQRQLLDDFGDHQHALKQVASAHEDWRQLQQELTALEAEAEARNEREQLLRYQLQELDALAPEADEYDTLVDQHRRLASADSNATRLQQALQLLDEGETTVSALLAAATQQLEQIDDSHPQLQASLEMLHSAQVNCEETVSELHRYQDALEPDPARLQALDERLATLHDLARKHRVGAEQLASLQQELQQELDALTDGQSRTTELEQQVAEAHATLQQRARTLSEARSKAARRMSKAVTGQLVELGMSRARFNVTLTALDGCGPHGAERIEYQVQTHPDMPAGPIGKVASGGELSRISLAIQVVTAATSETPSLVLDEADVGIGGRTAEVVGRLLRRLGDHAQVLAVTHLPQVAALGHQHLAVVKRDGRKGSNQVTIDSLDAQARIDELARMLGGVEITAQTQAHASEMLERAASA